MSFIAPPDLTIFILTIFLALAFSYINGFHDAANAIATVVSSKVLSARAALIYGGILNFAGALLGTEVAKTIGKGIVKPEFITPESIFCALLGACLWNLITWWRGLPSSSTQALIGSLCGVAVFASGFEQFGFSWQILFAWNHVRVDLLLGKVIIPMFTSPFLGFAMGYLIMLSIFWLCRHMPLKMSHTVFGKLQIFSAGYMALSHGTNDGQLAMGVIALSIATYFGTPFEVSLWIKVVCAITIGLGTLTGGWKIIRTMGSKMLKIQPVQGFAAEATAGTIIFTTAHFGIPTSTTHVVTSAIMGVGATKRLSAIKWTVVGQILVAWVMTIPASFLITGAVYLLLKAFTTAF